MSARPRVHQGHGTTPGKTELYLKNEGALEDYLLDSVCRETVLHRGDESPLANVELAVLVKRISHARRLRAQLDKRGDGRITVRCTIVEVRTGASLE